MRLRPALATVGWGLFCTCSWTWCIAMYLPLILQRHFGWTGVLVFALPNIIGCAAFGYVLGSRRASGSLVERHRTAMRLFSIAAVGYQAYFVSLLLANDAVLGSGVLAGAGLVGAGLLLSFLPIRFFPWLAVVVYAVSLATLAALGRIPDGGAVAVRERDLALLGPVIAFGFLFCPYLDLTFHRALAESPSRHAFVLFGIAFAVMLLLTCAYRDRLWPLAFVPAVHIVTQSLFTTAVHLRELRIPNRIEPRWPVVAAVLGGVAAACAVLVVDPSESPVPGEAIYLRFLVFFGLLFPTYVLIFMGPGRTLARTVRNHVVFAIAMLLAMPFYELGFIGGRTWLLVFPIAGLLAWKIVVVRRRAI